jgi:hypothetical protein
MVQVYYASGDPWDAHGDIMAHKVNAKASDQPFAAVIKDLKQRGLWKDTLVVCREEGSRSQSIRLHDVAGRWSGKGRHDLRRDG